MPGGPNFSNTDARGQRTPTTPGINSGQGFGNRPFGDAMPQM